MEQLIVGVHGYAAAEGRWTEMGVGRVGVERKREDPPPGGK